MQTKPLDELRQRLAARSSKPTPKPEAKATAKPKEPKPMNGGTRTTKNNTGLEDYSNNQLTHHIDYANTMQEAYRAVLELQNRFHKYRESLGNICHAELQRLEAEYQKYHNGNGASATYQPEPEPEHVPEPEPEPPLPPLSWEIIQAIEANECGYGPYIREIWESDWDYVDRRTNNTLMRKPPDETKDWAYTHKDDTGKKENLSDFQYGLMIVMLKAYFYHKRHPQAQAKARAMGTDIYAPAPF